MALEAKAGLVQFSPADGPAEAITKLVMRRPAAHIHPGLVGLVALHLLVRDKIFPPVFDETGAGFKKVKADVISRTFAA